MVFTEEELRASDPKLQELAGTDRKLIQLFGGTLHHNDGTYLAGSISPAINWSWQRIWKQIVAGPQTFYFRPRGKVSCRFLTLLCKE